MMDETNVGKFIGELIGKGKTVNYQKVGSVHSLTVEQLEGEGLLSKGYNMNKFNAEENSAAKVCRWEKRVKAQGVFMAQCNGTFQKVESSWNHCPFCGGKLVVEVRYPDIAMMVQLSARTFKERGPIAALHELEMKVQALKDKLVKQGEN